MSLEYLLPNRTILELKSFFTADTFNCGGSPNRTILELKLAKDYYRNGPKILLIVPSWN